jgi:anti-sigma factor RsiW
VSSRHECELIEDRLPNLLEHDLPAGETLLVRAHLDDCESCAAAFRDYEALAVAIAAEKPPAQFVELALARVRSSLADSPAPPRKSRHGWLVAGAVAFASLGFLVGPPTGASLDALRRGNSALLDRAGPVVNALHLPSFLTIDAEPPR